MLMRYAAVTLLIAVLTPSAVRAQSPAPARAGQEVKVSSLLGGAVTFTTPEAWQNPSHQGTDVVGLLQMTALYPVEEGDEPGEARKVVARIWLSASIENDMRSLKERSDESYVDTYHQPPPHPDLV